MVTGTLPFMGKGFWELWQRIPGGKYHGPFFASLECKNILKKLMTLDLRHRETLKQIMRDPRLHMGQEEELRPYSELPCDHMDPWVTEEMMNLGFGGPGPGLINR